jgi:hypothetical protein
MEGKRPLKSKNLKIIDYKDTYYATFDGTKYWKVEKWLFRLLKLCNGKRTVDEIAKEISKISGFPEDQIKIGLRPILEELEREKFIVYV